MRARGSWRPTVWASLASVLLLTILVGTPGMASAAGGAPVSDDFHASSLNTSLWTVVNPVGDGSVSLNGTNLLLSLPGGVNHDAWAGSNQSLRVLQSVGNVDWQVEAKFDSLGSSAYSDEGIQVEQDSGTYLRYDVYGAGGSSPMLFAASFAAGSPTVRLSQALPAGSVAPIWLRLSRSGSTFTMYWSKDGSAFTTAGSFTFGLTVARLGPYAGNAAGPSTPAPAWTASVDYFFNTASPISPEDGGTTTTAAIANDDFSAGSLNTSVWTFVNPKSDATLSFSGGDAVIAVPGGSSHDPTAAGDLSPRLMQNVTNGDFQVEAKFESAVSSSQQLQGIIVEQDSTHFIRFEVQRVGNQANLYAATISGTAMTVNVDNPIRNGTNFYLRVKRAGTTWSVSYSYDRQHWTPPVSFSQALTVARLGPFAGNASGASSPAFTTKIDYVVDDNSLPATEDGAAFPTAPTSPVINVWYGDTQSFGQIGQPQQWVNVLGDVADGAGVATLTYQLNGGAAQTLWMGENAVRLVEPGNFNVEIDYASLVAGANTVHIVATDTLGHQTAHDVTVSFTSGTTWPTSYNLNWSTLGGNISAGAQIVDGKWQIQADGSVRTTQTGYDRLLDIGDRSTWHDYEVTVPVKINAMDAAGSALGVVAGWQGHTTLQNGVALPDQPRTGHPFPVFFSYSLNSVHAPRLEIYANSASHPEQTLAYDTTGTTLTIGTTYIFKMRVQHNTIGGSHFSFKVWQSGGTEPTAWLVQADGDLSQGSILLGAHQSDVSFGNVAVTAL